LGVVKYLKESFGLTKDDAQTEDNYALWRSAANGHLEVVKYLKDAFGLTNEDAQSEDNYALRTSAENGHLEVVTYLKERVGLTKEDAQADDNYALQMSAANGHLEVVKYLKEAFGLDYPKKFVATEFVNDMLIYLKLQLVVHKLPDMLRDDGGAHECEHNVIILEESQCNKPRTHNECANVCPNVGRK